MDGDGNAGESALFVRLVDRTSRSVLFQASEDPRYPGVASFCQPQLLEIVSQTAVPVALASHIEIFYVLVGDAPVRSGEAQHRDPVRMYRDGDRFAYDVVPMIYCVRKDLLYRRKRIAACTCCPRGIRVLVDHDLHGLVLYVIRHLLKQDVQRTIETRFPHPLAGRIGHLHHVHIRVFDEPGGFLVEEQQASIDRVPIVGR